MNNEDPLEMSDNIGLTSKEDKDPYRKIYNALLGISKEDIDTGYGLDGMDCWVTIDGREYFITVKPSLRQTKAEAH